MPGVGLVQSNGQGQFQQFLPFGEADVVIPLLTKAPKARRDPELLARRAAMKPARAEKRAVAVTVSGASAFEVRKPEPAACVRRFTFGPATSHPAKDPRRVSLFRRLGLLNLRAWSVRLLNSTPARPPFPVKLAPGH